jgi:hypothetical protein
MAFKTLNIKGQAEMSTSTFWAGDGFETSRAAAARDIRLRNDLSLMEDGKFASFSSNLIFAS